MARGNEAEDVQSDTVRGEPLSRCPIGFVSRCRRLETANKSVARQRTYSRWPGVYGFMLDVGRSRIL